jgi:hypothetical protein
MMHRGDLAFITVKGDKCVGGVEHLSHGGVIAVVMCVSAKQARR